jgi:excisionase family DNA binding protein
MAEEYLTVAEAAVVLRIHKQTVYRLVWAEILPRIDIGQGKSRPRFRIRRSAIDALMADNEKGKAA